jgi:hypothetical protein
MNKRASGALFLVTTHLGIQVSNAKAPRCKERQGTTFFCVALRPLQLGAFALEADLGVDLSNYFFYAI